MAKLEIFPEAVLRQTVHRSSSAIVLTRSAAYNPSMDHSALIDRCVPDRSIDCCRHCRTKTVDARPLRAGEISFHREASCSLPSSTSWRRGGPRRCVSPFRVPSRRSRRPAGRSKWINILNLFHVGRPVVASINSDGLARDAPGPVDTRMAGNVSRRRRVGGRPRVAPHHRRQHLPPRETGVLLNLRLAGRVRRLRNAGLVSPPPAGKT